MSLLFLEGFGYNDRSSKWNTGTVDNGSITTTSPRVPGAITPTVATSTLHKNITASAQVRIWHVSRGKQNPFLW